MLNSLSVTAEDICKQVRLSYQMPEVIQELLTRKIIKHEAEEIGLLVTDEELQQVADKIRLIYQLHKAEDTWKWLERNYLSIDDFEEIVYDTALSTKLGSHLFSHKVEPYFFAHQLDYTGVILYEIILDDEDLATELFFSIQEGEIGFHEVAHRYIKDTELRRKGGYQGILYRKDLKPEVSAAVFTASPPQLLKPIITAKGVHLILVEELIQPKLDNNIRIKILRTLYDEWLKEKKIDLDFTVKI